jgi:hypothetical protein
MPPCAVGQDVGLSEAERDQRNELLKMAGCGRAPQKLTVAIYHGPRPRQTGDTRATLSRHLPVPCAVILFVALLATASARWALEIGSSQDPLGTLLSRYVEALRRAE